jgi:hypothetical protein
LNGRSVRAGARRLTDFFSGKGKGALSSLAAAAGGGVTAILRRISNQDDPRNDKCAITATPENRMPICVIGLRQQAATS